MKVIKPALAGTQFKTKIEPHRQAQGWSYSSHQESIGKPLSSPGIRSNKKAYTNCGSSARMARISHQPSKRNNAINGSLSHLRVDPFILYVPPSYQSLQEVVLGDRRTE
ncbi:hypothetical protein [Absidia glauca]|uniref:Ndc10 domain-containing protein n=1 Tax=Absidia glauca TaxID=4829 RepID=A0A168MDP8_ABSGL|nr:hypothetical protein [Absidia glauca]